MPSPSERAAALHESSVVIDLHADTLELVRLGYRFDREHRPFAWASHLLGHVDLPRLRRGGVTATFFGAIVPPWARGRAAMQRVGRQVALLDRLCHELDDAMVRAQTAEEVLAAKREGRVAALVGVEGSYGLTEVPGAAETLAGHGVRYVGPAHLAPSRSAPSSLAPGKGQISEDGRRFVAELQQASIIVDLAHLARGPFLEICRESTRPVLVSHTGVHARNALWRNIDDEQIRAVAATGGVVGVIFSPGFLGLPGVDGIAEHVEHLVRLGGTDLPALGSDFDGLVRPPSDLRDAAGLPLVTDALLRRGMDEATIRKVLGENVLRLLREVPPPRRAAPGP